QLAAQRQDRLEPAVAALLRRAAGRIALDDVELALGGVALLAVGELARQRHPLEGTLADHEVPGLARRFSCAGRGQALLDDPASVGWALVQVLGDAFRDRSLHLALDLGVAELGLGLAFELWLQQLDADHGREPFTNVLAREVARAFADDAGAFRV